MRLAVVSPFLDHRHGTERAVSELLDRLNREYRCEIHVFAQRVADLAIEPWTPQRASECGVIFWHPVPSVRGPLLFGFVSWFFLNRLSRWWFAIRHHVRFDFVLSAGINCSDADVVIVHAIFERLRQLARDPGYADIQTLSLARRLHRSTYYALLARLERRIYGNRRVALAAVSTRTAGQLSTLFHRDDVRVVPNGIDTMQFSSPRRLTLRQSARESRKLGPDDFVLLLIGNDWAVKGVATILRAMALLPDLPVHLIVVGSDVPRAFQKMADELGLSRRCHWEESATEVFDFYAAADVYVSPTREDSFALPVGEAMASGLPVITSVFAGISSLVQDGIDAFVLSDPLDASTLAKLLQLLHDQVELRDRIGSSAARTAQAWTWDRSAAALWELLSSLKTD